VNFLRNKSILSKVSALWALLAWIVLSNHCAFAQAFGPRTTIGAEVEERGCCPGSDGSQDDQVPCPQMPQGCCKSLKVTTPEMAKVPAVSAAGELLPVHLESLETPAPCLNPGNAASFDTGPPCDVPTFAELVLNRSLLSHAPPVLA
jgi:hypothetical protein